MTVIDSKRISLEQVSDNQNGKVVDEVMIHKDQQDRDKDRVSIAALLPLS